MSSLARNLKLSIERESNPDKTGLDQLKLTLENELAMMEVTVCCRIENRTANKNYHTREALVIAMRRLVSAAIDQGMISIYPGTSAILKSGLGRS